MNYEFNENIYQTQLSDKDFKRLSDFIQNNYGIKMPPAKKIVLQGRLHKRLRVITSYSIHYTKLYEISPCPSLLKT